MITDDMKTYKNLQKCLQKKFIRNNVR